MEKIRLANGNAYGIESGATERRCSMIFATLSESVPVIEDFTEANMETVEFLTEAGEVCGSYTNKYLVSAETFTPEDGTCRVVFHMGDVDMVAKRLATLEESQAIQDEAIIELASIVAE